MADQPRLERVLGEREQDPVEEVVESLEQATQVAHPVEDRVRLPIRRVQVVV